jgi:hypothetical protein
MRTNPNTKKPNHNNATIGIAICIGSCLVAWWAIIALVINI